MAFNTIKKNIGDAGTGLDRSLYGILKELQGVKLNAVAGAAANTNIALAGVGLKDTIISVVNLTDGVDVPLANVTIQAAGQIRVSTDTSAKKLLVHWAPKPT